MWEISARTRSTVKELTFSKMARSGQAISSRENKTALANKHYRMEQQRQLFIETVSSKQRNQTKKEKKN